jgi:hypothetical protein
LRVIAVISWRSSMSIGRQRVADDAGRAGKEGPHDIVFRVRPSTATGA